MIYETYKFKTEVTHFNSAIAKEQKQITVVKREEIQQLRSVQTRKHPLLTEKMNKKQISTEKKNMGRSMAKTTTQKKLTKENPMANRMNQQKKQNRMWILLRMNLVMINLMN